MFQGILDSIMPKWTNPAKPLLDKNGKPFINIMNGDTSSNGLMSKAQGDSTFLPTFLGQEANPIEKVYNFTSGEVKWASIVD